MKQVALLLLTVLLANVCCAQIEFTSSGGEFKLTLPAKPTEARDTLKTALGRLPIYKMVLESAEKGTNLRYDVIIYDESRLSRPLSIDTLKLNLTHNLAMMGMGSKIIRDSKLQEQGTPFELEWVIDHKKLGAINFTRLFRRNGRLYRVETVQNAGRVKFSTEPNEITTKYFQSFKLRD